MLVNVREYVQTPLVHNFVWPKLRAVMGQGPASGFHA